MNKLIILSLSILLVGCASVSQSDKWLTDNRDIVELGFVQAGIMVMDNALNDEERKSISDQMWAISVMFNSMAGQNKVFRTVELEETLRQFAPSWNSPDFAIERQSVALIWGLVENRLEKLLQNSVHQDIQEAINLSDHALLILATSAQKVAEHYKGKPNV